MDILTDNGIERAIDGRSTSLALAFGPDGDGPPVSAARFDPVRLASASLFDQVGMRRFWADFRHLSDVRAEIREERLAGTIRGVTRSRPDWRRQLLPTGFPRDAQI